MHTKETLHKGLQELIDHHIHTAGVDLSRLRIGAFGPENDTVKPFYMIFEPKRILGKESWADPWGTAAIHALRKEWQMGDDAMPVAVCTESGTKGFRVEFAMVREKDLRETPSGILSELGWGEETLNENSLGYWRRSLSMAYALTTGEWPPGDTRHKPLKTLEGRI